MINIVDEKKCCGCGACIDICPKKCIMMEERTLGHLFPKVNTDLCISCNLCDTVCPMTNELQGCGNNNISYITYNNERNIRKKSSSGGMFYSFASQLIKDGYIIFGAKFNDNLVLETSYTDNLDSLDSYCKSKYLQSNTKDVYLRIRNFLNEGKKVMYTGTPCQIKALRLFLKKDYENLFLIDFFCHGVPSQKYFDQCRKLVEDNKRIKIHKYSFRTKITGGCTPHYFTCEYEKKGKIKSKTDFYYNSPNYAAFQKYINLRESCYDCKFSSRDRMSDITLGDFHNIEKYNKNIDRFDGVSTLIINTAKGKKMLELIRNNIYLEEINIDFLISNKEIFAGGTKRPNDRNQFIKDYEYMDFSKLNKKWFGKRKYMKQVFYYHMPKFLRKIIKNLGGD